MSARLPTTVIGAAIALVAASAFSPCGGDDTASTPASPPQAWVAIAPPAAAGHTGSITIFEASSPPATTTVGPDSHYAALHWSPDGARLAAFDLRDPNTVHLVVFDRAHPATPTLDLAGDWMDYAWSPDAARLLVLARTHLLMFDTAGRQLGKVDIPALPDDSMAVSGMGRRSWSPDSRRAAAFVNGQLLLIDRDGHGQAIDPASSRLDITGRGFQFIGWTDSTHIGAIYAGAFSQGAGASSSPPAPRMVEITVRGDNLTWRLSSFDPNALHSVVPTLDEAALSSLAGRLAFQSATADGSAPLTETQPADGGVRSIAYWLRGQPRMLDLADFPFPPSGVPLLRTGAVDVVLVHP